ncbi:MAG TPA: nucleotide exchange factor GrpE [Blastocatellia bacterium]|nr:nucleotide exchange factor GrpE [Blastocatellia bacterium]
MKKNEPREIPIQIDGEEDLRAEEASASAPDEQAIENLSASDVDADGAAASDDPKPQADDAVARLQAQVDQLAQEKAALYDQLLRRQAEFENYRKRVERERGETYQRARAEVLLELLPIVDNFERALSSIERSEGDAASLKHGVELIHKQFNDALLKFGLEPVEAVGQSFDPHLHEAVTIEPSEEHEENTVIEEFQRGYKMGDKLLRPARVKVASSPEK